jgi:hypothetical protein
VTAKDYKGIVYTQSSTLSNMRAIEYLLAGARPTSERTGQYFTTHFRSTYPRGRDVTVLQLLHILIPHIQNREVTSLAALRSHKDTAVIATFEVALALDCAIVLACRLVERDADPDTDAWNLGDEANVRDGTATCVGLGKEAYTC